MSDALFVMAGSTGLEPATSGLTVFFEIETIELHRDESDGIYGARILRFA
jgi:hypothetical protein